MHYITLDTNTWIYLANGTEPVRLLHFIKKEVVKGNITILLPRTVIDEWDVHKDKTVKKGSLKHFKDIENELNKISKLLGEKGEKDAFSFLFEETNESDETDYFEDVVEKFKRKKIEVQNAVNENIELIDELFKTQSKIIEIKDDIYIKSGQYALEKKAPFKFKNSFADALILFSFLDYVEKKSIEGAMFISYNTDDFCEKKEKEKNLHPDLLGEFKKSNSLYYKIVGEALNTIKKDIVSKEELILIEELQNAKIHSDELEMCEFCRENEGNVSELYFFEEPLLDERITPVENPNQTAFDFAKTIPKSLPIETSETISISQCNQCGSEHFRCIDCETVNAVWESDYNTDKECEGCGLNYHLKRTYTGEGLDEIEYSIPKETETCDDCGNEFNQESMIENLCIVCENRHSYG